MGTHPAATRERNIARLSRKLQRRGHPLSCHQERAYRECVCDACHSGKNEAADEVPRLDYGLYKKGCWTEQREGVRLHTPGRWVLFPYIKHVIIIKAAWFFLFKKWTQKLWRWTRWSAMPENLSVSSVDIIFTLGSIQSWLNCTCFGTCCRTFPLYISA